jgi:predicted lipid-binding transport protein (Tim44 family)
MKNMKGFFATVLISLTLVLASVPDAEARRFGAGRSFGGKSSYGSPFKRSAKSTATRSASQKKAHNQNQAARQGMSRRGGLMGMLGGLALGGLLGSMFLGGAFEGINFMDILMFGGIGYLLFKLFAAKAGAGRRPAYNQSGGTPQQSEYKAEPLAGVTQQRTADFNTDRMFTKDKKHNESFQQSADQIDADFEEDIVPAGFDEADFLDGAKGAYKDLQKAWDSRDLAEIRGLTTDKVFAEIQEQLQASSEINQTDVLKVDAELLSVREIGSDLEAVVLFDSIIREDDSAQAEQVREVWHFIKTKNSLQPKWHLDGIQQLEQ